MQCPVYNCMEETLEDPTITDPSERERIYGQNDHLRKYGKDYGDRIRSAGFEVTEDDYLHELDEETRKCYFRSRKIEGSVFNSYSQVLHKKIGAL